MKTCLNQNRTRQNQARPRLPFQYLISDNRKQIAFKINLDYIDSCESFKTAFDKIEDFEIDNVLYSDEISPEDFIQKLINKTPNIYEL